MVAHDRLVAQGDESKNQCKSKFNGKAMGNIGIVYENIVWGKIVYLEWQIKKISRPIYWLISNLNSSLVNIFEVKDSYEDGEVLPINSHDGMKY